MPRRQREIRPARCRVSQTRLGLTAAIGHAPTAAESNRHVTQKGKKGGQRLVTLSLIYSPVHVDRRPAVRRPPQQADVRSVHSAALGPTATESTCIWASRGLPLLGDFRLLADLCGAQAYLQPDEQTPCGGADLLLADTLLHADLLLAYLLLADLRGMWTFS